MAAEPVRTSARAWFLITCPEISIPPSNFKSLPGPKIRAQLEPPPTISKIPWHSLTVFKGLNSQDIPLPALFGNKTFTFLAIKVPVGFITP